MYEDQTEIWEISWPNNIVKIIWNKRDTMLVKEYPGPRIKEQITPNRGDFWTCSTGPAHYDNKNQSRANYKSQKREEEREKELNSNSKIDEKDPKSSKVALFSSLHLPFNNNPWNTQ